VVAITWAPSADKHGIDREDALHAIMNAYFVQREFDEPRPPANIRPTLFIGPPRQLGGELLEVMVEINPPRDLHVFHVMVARRKHLERMEEER
jgi:hypothetical protein